MRAVVESPRLTQLAGINSEVVSMGSWMLCGALAGLGGVLLGPLSPSIDPNNYTSLIIAATGVLVLMTLAGEFPWIAVVLALSFGFYSTIRKATPVDGLVGLTIETIFLFPAAAGYLLWLWQQQTLVFGTGTLTVDAWIMASGIITSVPMVFFGQAARRLRLSTLGFIQFLSPTLQFILAVAVFGESFPPRKVVGFVIIWVAVVIFIIDSIVAVHRGTATPPVEAPVE